MRTSIFSLACICLLFFSAAETNPLAAQCNISGATTNNTCFGIPDGQVDIAISAGNWTYSWSDGSNQQDRVNLYNDVNYTVTATCISGQCVSYCTTVTYSTSVTPANNDDWPQATGNPLTGTVVDDNVIATFADSEENTYFLGTFVNNMYISGTTISTGTSGPTGMYIAKFDPCGNLEWVDYTELSGFDIKPVDMVLVTESGVDYIYIFGSTSNDNVSFDLEQTAGSDQVNVGTGEESFLLKIKADDGEYDDSESISSIDYSDNLFDMEINEEKFYIAGEQGSNAIIHEIDLTGYISFLLEDQGSGTSYYTDIEWRNGILIGVGSATIEIDFGSSDPIAGNSDAFIVLDNGTNIYTEVAGTQSGEDAEAVDCEFDENGIILVLGNYQGELSNWNLPNSTNPNFFLVQINPNSTFDPGPSVNAHESTMQSVRAIDLGLMQGGAAYVLGSFVGSQIQFSPSPSLPHYAPGAEPANALWIAEFDPNLGGNHWVTSNWSAHEEDINPVAMAVGPYNCVVTGTFIDDINTSHNSPLAMDNDLDHADPGENAVFFIRYGSFNNLLSEGQVYKTSSPNNHETEGKEAAQALTKETFSVFPNPANNTVYLNIPGMSSKEIHLTLSDVSGQVVYSNEGLAPESGQMEIKLHGIPPGVYLLQAKAQNRTWQSKLVIQ